MPNTIDYNVGIAAVVTNWQRAGVYYGINVTGISLSTGQVLWTKTIYDAQYSGSTDIADHGKIATLTLNQGFFAFDLATGNLAWQSEPMDYPWDAAGFGGYSVQSAYGLLYRQGYSGIYAFDWDDLGSNQSAGNRYRLINWTTLGTSTNFASRVTGNISWPISNVPNTIDYNVNIAASVVNWQRAGVYYGINVTGISLSTGQVLWTKTIYDAQYSGSTDIADHGKIATLTLNQGFFAFDLSTGNLAWQSEPMDYPWDAAGFGGYSVQSAYGLLYRQGYSGIYAFDWDTGKVVWKYEAPADYPYETPYVNEAGEGMYSWNIGANIADGKMYAYNTEHSATVPITRGWKFHCINATTGEKIWAVAIPGACIQTQPRRWSNTRWLRTTFQL